MEHKEKIMTCKNQGKKQRNTRNPLLRINKPPKEKKKKSKLSITH